MMQSKPTIMILWIASMIHFMSFVVAKNISKIEEYVEKTPFNRVEIYDFYTNFKALSKLCVDNMRSRRDQRDRYMRKKKQVDYVGEMIKTK